MDGGQLSNGGQVETAKGSLKQSYLNLGSFFSDMMLEINWMTGVNLD